jgi:PAS domain S-box-containing protein
VRVKNEIESATFEELFRALLESASDAVVIVSREGRIRHVNAQTERLFGYDRANLLGESAQMLIPGRLREKNLPEVSAYLADPRPRRLDACGLRKDGTEFPIEMNLSVLPIPGGTLVATTIHDTTEQRRADALLEESMRKTRLLQSEIEQNGERSRLLIDGVRDYALYTLDPEGRVSSWNTGAQRIKGYTEEEILGLHFSVFYEPDDIKGGRPAQELRRATETGRYEEEGRRVRKDGTSFWASVIITSLRSPDGRLRGFAKITRDITERKETELALRSFTERLQRSNEELREFAMIASHDLQEPLRKVQMFGDRLKSEFADALGPTGQDYLGRMQNAASRGQALIQGLLAYSRLTTKAPPPSLVDLGVVAAEVVSDLEAQIGQVGGTVEMGPLPAIQGDALQMRQLFQNLVGNALKFHREGVPPVVRVSATIARLQGSLCVWQIEIADNGIGFDERYLDRIFKLFQRLHERGTYEGAGMGLAICRKIAEHHHGAITARSVPGQGTTMLVTLPSMQPEEGKSR